MEYFSFEYLVQQLGAPVVGIVHVGAHYGEEAPDYHARGVRGLWVEAHPEYAKMMFANLDQYDTQEGIQALFSDTDGDEVDFWITADEFASSMLKPALHQIQNPHAYTTGSIKLRTQRFDTYMDTSDWGAHLNWGEYNVLVLDVQGAELKVWNGMGDYQECFEAIISEYSTVEFYEGVPRLTDLEQAYEGFDRVYPELGQELWHGDALFIRRQ